MTESQHELIDILNAVDKEQQESPCSIELDNYPEKYHELILQWLNGQITLNQAIGWFGFDAPTKK